LNYHSHSFSFCPVRYDKYQAVLAATKGSHYRGDLANLAVARYHALARGINNAKRGIAKKAQK
jgi:hypothetical protein